MTTPERSVDENGEKFNLVHATRYFGKSYDVAQKLYYEIQKAEKTILFKTPKGDVHILPQGKLDELLQAERQKQEEMVRRINEQVDITEYIIVNSAGSKEAIEGAFWKLREALTQTNNK